MEVLPALMADECSGSTRASGVDAFPGAVFPRAVLRHRERRTTKGARAIDAGHRIAPTSEGTTFPDFTGPTGVLGVEAGNVGRAVDPPVIGRTEGGQVFRPIVIPDTVDVVDVFVGTEQPPVGLLPDQPMFRHLAEPIGGGVVGSMHQDIPAIHDTPAFPQVVRGAFAHRGVAMHVLGRVPFQDTSTGAGPSGDRGRLTTPAQAES